jgi:hypothetical protein
MTTDLERFRDHARHMAKDLYATPPEKQLWTQLADEINDYLTNTPEPTIDPPTLFNTPDNNP